MGTDLSAALKFRSFKALKRYFSLMSECCGAVSVWDKPGTTLPDCDGSGEGNIHRLDEAKGALVFGLSLGLGL